MRKSTDYLLPLFKGESAKQILKAVNSSRIKPYTSEEKKCAELKISELLKDNNSKNK